MKLQVKKNTAPPLATDTREEGWAGADKELESHFEETDVPPEKSGKVDGFFGGAEIEGKNYSFPGM